ncbi:MAG: hypothetical protein M0R37_14895 [Bacteroidales bacterium]|jgi:hypothetical protein|nr:hypothetical protein [Bacteroidales bacterium]
MNTNTEHTATEITKHWDNTVANRRRWAVAPSVAPTDADVEDMEAAWARRESEDAE